jgi:hypothetical protein
MHVHVDVVAIDVVARVRAYSYMHDRYLELELER